MLTRRLRKALVKASYARYLTLGAVLGVASVIVVLSLFANYVRAAQVHLTGIHPHLAIRKASITHQDRVRVASVLASLGAAIVGHAPAIDLAIEAEITEADTTPVVCAERAGERGCYDFANAERMRGWTLREATGFELGKTRVGAVRLRGIEVDSQGGTLLDLTRVLDVRASAEDLVRLEQGAREGMPPAVLFERTFFHGAKPLDDFLVAFEASGAGDPRHVRLLSTINLGLARSQHPVIIASLEQAQELLGRTGFVNVIDVRLRQPERADAIAATLAVTLEPDGFSVDSWRQADAGAFRLLGVLGVVTTLVISSVVLIAAMSIASTLSLVVIESRRTIAMLRALGLRDRGIFATLLLAAGRIAGLGLVGGTALGVAASAALLELPGFRGGLAKMGIRQPDVVIEPASLAILSVATLALFFVVAWAPARAACRVDPVEGLTS